MTPARILQFDALASAGCALALIVAGAWLAPHFGLASPALLQSVGVALLGYVALLVWTSRRPAIERSQLLAFAAADVLWVVGSAALLVLFWGEMTVLARTLIVAVALVVEAIGVLKYVAAGRVSAAASPRLA
jgi:hypothetical protein